MRKFDLVIFDWDGTLFQSIGLIEESIVRAGDAVGHKIAPATARHIIGLGLRAAQGILFPDMHPSEQFLRNFHLAYREHYEGRQASLVLYPGAYDLVRDLVAHGATVAVATAKSRAGIDRALERTGLGEYVSFSRTPEECRPKPDPQMVDEIVLASGKLKTTAVMVGDTTHDLKMGLNAGVQIAGLSHGAHAATDLEALAPAQVFADITALRNFVLSPHE